MPESKYYPGPSYWRSSTESGGLAPSTPETSGIVNPPVHAGAVLNVLLRDSSTDTLDWAGRIVPKVAKFIKYLVSNRDPDHNNLVYVRHPWENGMDNSPVWDTVLDAMPKITKCKNHSLPLGQVPVGCVIPPYKRVDIKPGTDPKDRPTNLTYDRFTFLMICARNRTYNEALISADDGCPFLVEDVFFNVLVAQASQAMADIIAQLARYGRSVSIDPAEYWLNLATRIKQAIASVMWEPSISMYASRNQRTGKLLPTRTIGGLSPLMLSAANDKDDFMRRATLIEQLQSPGFALPFPVPTFDATVTGPRGFSPQLYWRGPTWYNTDWLMLRGLQSSANTTTLAKNLKSAMYKLIDNDAGQSPFTEYWDPRNGKPHGTGGKGTGGFSWTAALFLDIFCPQVTIASESPSDPKLQQPVDAVLIAVAVTVIVVVLLVVGFVAAGIFVLMRRTSKKMETPVENPDQVLL